MDLNYLTKRAKDLLCELGYNKIQVRWMPKKYRRRFYGYVQRKILLSDGIPIFQEVIIFLNPDESEKMEKTFLHEIDHLRERRCAE